MELDLFDLAHQNVTLLLFLVIGIGYLIGNFKVGGISAGNTTGVLLAGMLFGHFGFPDVSAVKVIYNVQIQCNKFFLNVSTSTKFN